MELKVNFPCWAVNEVKVTPSLGKGPPLASPAFLAESSASCSPPAAWQMPQPVEPPELLPPPDGHPLAFQTPAGHYGSPPLHTVMLTQISSCKTAHLHPLPPPEQADHQSPPPGRTQHKHYQGCPKRLEPLRLGGSPGSLQAWPDQLHSMLHWAKSSKKLKLGCRMREIKQLLPCPSVYFPKQCVFFILPANHPSLLVNTLTANEHARNPVSQAAVAPPPYFQVPWIYLSRAPPLFHWDSQSWGTGGGQRGNGSGNNLENSPLPLSTFLLFRALVLHTSIGRQRGLRCGSRPGLSTVTH